MLITSKMTEALVVLVEGKVVIARGEEIIIDQLKITGEGLARVVGTTMTVKLRVDSSGILVVHQEAIH